VRSARGPDDAEVIRARLRALLADRDDGGWVPGDTDPGASAPLDRSGAVGSPEDPGEDDGPIPSGPLDAGRHRAPGPVLRLDPGRPGARALWLAAVGAVVVLLVLTWLARPTPTPVPAAGPVPGSAPAPADAVPAEGNRPSTAPSTGTPGTVVVSVVGQVARPGLVTLAEGARVADAVEAAGGLLPGADAGTVNLAAPLADGQQVAVGVPGSTGPAGPAGPAGGSPGAGGPVDLNTAGAAELEALPGVGPVLAQRILDHREQHGPFGSVEELEDVPGIGPAIYDGLADSVTV
jgi:competence protein ComEA